LPDGAPSAIASAGRPLDLRFEYERQMPLIRALIALFMLNYWPLYVQVRSRADSLVARSRSNPNPTIDTS
jgi:hypothetical protein